jgi:hypothetical protein
MGGTKPNALLQCKKVSKSENFGNFGPLIEHGPHWINFTILIFINEKNRYFKCVYTILSKIISFNMRRKGEI